MNGDATALVGVVSLVSALMLGWWAVSGRRALPEGADEGDARLMSLSEPTAGRVLTPLARWLGRRALRWSPAHRVARAQRRLDRAGLGGSWTPVTLLGVRVLAALVLGTVFMVRLVLDPGSAAVVALVAVVLVGWWAPDLWLINRGEHRRQDMQVSVPDTIDQLAVLVRAGLGIDAAMNRCAQSDPGPLGRELARVVQELRLGATRHDALTDLVERTGVNDLGAVVTALAQAEELGVPVSETLRIQADEVRVRRRQRAAEHAMKLPVKILLPLVVCIFPVLLIVLLGPAVLTIADELGR